MNDHTVTMASTERLMRAPHSSGRHFTRAILHINAALLMIPGMVCFMLTLIYAVLIIIGATSEEQTNLSDTVLWGGLSVIWLIAISAGLLLFGVSIYWMLLVEEHLHKIRWGRKQ